MHGLLPGKCNNIENNMAATSVLKPILDLKMRRQKENMSQRKTSGGVNCCLFAEVAEV